MKRFVYLAGILLSAFTTVACSDGGDNTGGDPPVTQPETGKIADAQAYAGVLPPWQPGYLDIHFINTVTGESALIIGPDGTQMLIDAASSLATTGKDGLLQRWNPTQRGSQIIAGYIKRCMAWTSNNTLDYMLATHFHNDHMGGFSTDLPVSQNSSTYRLNGVTEILDIFPVTCMIDRGYPDYNYPYNLRDSRLEKNRAAISNNYCAAIDWHKANKGLRVEMFDAGSASQLKLVRDPGAYPGFSIQNVYVNGKMWTGAGTNTREIFPPRNEFSGTGEHPQSSPCENACSIVFLLHYGKFDYYAGADVCNSGKSYFSWKAVEDELTPVLSPVEVMKADHHGVDGANAQSLLTKLDPEFIICTPWQDQHPRTAVHERFASKSTHAGNAKILYTNLAATQLATFKSGLANIEYGGHVVIRVNPGGEAYHVYMIDDQTTNFDILRAIGPVTCN